MWPSLRQDAVTFTLAACVALAAAAVEVGRGNGSDSTDASAMDETTGSVSRPQRVTAGLALSDEQRAQIYESVMRLAVPVAPAPAPAVADALPQGVPMQDLPPGVTREIPLARGHKFVKFDDRIVVVDPMSRLVVAMIPRYKLLP